MAEAYRQAHVLLSAHAAGVFHILDEAQPLDVVTEHTGWHPRATRLMLDALVAMDLLQRQGTSYENAAVARHCLGPNAARPLHHFLAHTRRSLASWCALDGALRRGSGEKRGGHPAGSDAERDYVLAMDELAEGNTQATVAAIPLEDGASILDLGCGAGAYARAFLRAHPHVRLSLFDRSSVLAYARKKKVDASAAARCTFLPGDALRDPIGERYGLIFVSNVLHGYGEHDVRELLAKCHAALEPGGRLAVRDFLAGNQPEDPPFAALFALHMFLHAEAGQTHSEAQLSQWATDAGFASAEAAPVGRKASLWSARKSD